MNSEDFQAVRRPGHEPWRRRHAVAGGSNECLCRWILSTLDRLPSNELTMTHGRIAHVLGVRRERITETAVKLQKAGLIRYSRGHIAVLDRLGLEARACECYAVSRRERDRLVHECRQAGECAERASAESPGQDWS